MNKKLDIALIGVGYWGSKLARYVKENSHFNLKYMCNSKFDLDKVWNDQNIKAVIIATPNITHYELVKTALLNNKNVLVEKPLTLKFQECKELGELSQKKILVLFTEYTYTFSKGLQQAAEWIENGEIGKLVSIEMNVRHLGRFGGGSVYWLLGSHLLSVLNMFVPLKTLKFQRRDLVIYDNEVETGIINFDGLIKGQIVVCLNHPVKETKIIFYGESGTIIYDPVTFLVPLQLTNYDRVKWTISSKLPKRTKTYAECESHNLRYAISTFYEVLIGKKKSNFEVAKKITGLLEEIQK